MVGRLKADCTGPHLIRLSVSAPDCTDSTSSVQQDVRRGQHGQRQHLDLQP